MDGWSASVNLRIWTDWKVTWLTGSERSVHQGLTRWLDHHSGFSLNCKGSPRAICGAWLELSDCACVQTGSRGGALGPLLFEHYLKLILV